jgi:hypothetical protein
MMEIDVDALEKNKMNVDHSWPYAEIRSLQCKGCNQKQGITNGLSYVEFKFRDAVYNHMHEQRMQQGRSMVEYCTPEGMAAWKAAFEEAWNKIQRLIESGSSGAVTAPLVAIPNPPNPDMRLVRVYHESRRTVEPQEYIKSRIGTDMMTSFKASLLAYGKNTGGKVPEDNDPFWMAYPTATLPFKAYAEHRGLCGVRRDVGYPAFTSRLAFRLTCKTPGCIGQQRLYYNRSGTASKICQHCERSRAKLNKVNK